MSGFPLREFFTATRISGMSFEGKMSTSLVYIFGVHLMICPYSGLKLTNGWRVFVTFQLNFERGNFCFSKLALPS